MKVLIAIPVLNEEKILANTIETIRRYVRESLFSLDVTIVIADNGSNDATGAIGRDLAAQFLDVQYVRVEERGKGIAIRHAWNAIDADVYAFMDADLATDLAALPELLWQAQHGVAIGSRYTQGSMVERSGFRKMLSHGYRALLRFVLGTRISDAPCGFKAVNTAVKRTILPAVQNDQWFFDTELVIRAERDGVTVHEVPVAWREAQPQGRKSKVRFMKLIFEYVREVLRLRREFTSRKDTLLIAAVSFSLIILTSIPALAALLIAHAQGVVWSGRVHLSPGDLAVYLSSIAQAGHGKFFLENMATTERLIPVPNVIWSLGGVFTKLGLSTFGAYQALRILFIPVFVAVSWGALKHFVPKRTPRVVALLLFHFGSGFGALTALFLQATAATQSTYQWPIDLWVAESNAFLSAMYSPHFIASWTLLIAALWMFSKALSEERIRYAVLSGVCALLLFQFHPFYVPMLYAVGCIWAVFAVFRGKNIHKVFKRYAIFVALSLPAVIYYFWLTKFTLNGVGMVGQNLLWTPSPVFVLLGFGAFAILAFFGGVSELTLWALTTMVLLYIPFTFQRRLLEGKQFPLAALAGIVLVHAYNRMKPLSGFMAAASTVLLTIAFFPSTFYGIVAPIKMMSAPKYTHIFFFSKEENAALEWIRKNTTRDAVFLSEVDMGNNILGWGERTVYAGHWAATIDVVTKKQKVDAFFRSMNERERLAFLHEYHISYIFDRGDKLVNNAPLRQVFQSGEIRIYQAR